MLLPIQAQPVMRNVSTVELTDNSGILPSKKCGWNCGIYVRNPFTGKKKRVGTDPVCSKTKELCQTCMNVCSALPPGSHARKVCEDKC